MKPIYEPKGRAKEYSEEIKGEFYSNYALNIYTGCTHRCSYCYSPLVLKRNRLDFFIDVEPRANIVEATKKQLAADFKGITGKSIFLCFTCDPFPMGRDQTATYQIIEAIKNSGNHVSILTKGNPDTEQLSKLLDSNDKFGVTISCGEIAAIRYEPDANSVYARVRYLAWAKEQGIKNFVSCEPVLEPEFIYFMIENYSDFIDQFRVGKLNYFEDKLGINIDLKEFGKKCEELLIQKGKSYLIKEDLRKIKK